MIYIETTNTTNMEKLCGKFTQVKIFKINTTSIVRKIVRLAKVPKEISLETYRKQITTWDKVNGQQVPGFDKILEDQTRM